MVTVDEETNLGNFLSGMETEKLKKIISETADLGNFLSGMETGLLQHTLSPSRRLGNFLSGMETERGGSVQVVPAPLETSLVEWKLGI